MKEGSRGKKSVELEFSFIEESDIEEGHKAQSSSSLDRDRQTETILIMFLFIYSLLLTQLTAFSCIVNNLSFLDKFLIFNHHS